jgi:hypothetical protein
MRCKRRTCPSCGVLWAGDTRVKLQRNTEAYGGDVTVGTITAPGRDVLPHDGDGQVVLDAASRWNAHAPGAWSRMHRRASARTRRYARRMGGEWMGPLGASWEFQRRGVLHRHFVLPMATHLDRLCARYYVACLDELRHEFGFGFVDRGRRRRHRWSRQLEVVPAQRAGRYLAKYIAGLKSDGRLALTETVTHRDVPGHVTYVSRRLTARTGCTMRSLREARRQFRVDERYGAEVAAIMGRIRRGDDPTPDEVVLVVAALSHSGP